MKNVFRNLFQVLFLSLVLVGCNDDITLKGTLSGTISNYSEGSFDGIQCKEDVSHNIIGTGTPTSSGKFSIKLSMPYLNDLSSTPSGLVVSDKFARIGSLSDIEIRLQGTIKGQLMKCNNIFDGYSTLKGMELVTFMYSDRPCTITGYGLNGSISYTYDLKLKTGWNEVMLIQESANNQTLTTKIAKDLEWRCFFFNASQNVKKYKVLELN